MTERARRPSLRASRGTISVGLVLALAGLLFTANARLATGAEQRHPQDLGELAKVEAARVKSLSGDVDELRAEVEQLAADQGAAAVLGEPGALDRSSVADGRAAVTGPGVTVTLTDAPTGSPRTERFSPDDLVVHQQDLQAVVNALWAGGAEAMALQDQRVIGTTAFRCVGNVLSLGGRLYSPPYEVRAIGDPKELREALFADAEIQKYLGYVEQAGLGWSLTTQDTLELPGSVGSTELRFASVPTGTKVF